MSCSGRANCETKVLGLESLFEKGRKIQSRTRSALQNTRKGGSYVPKRYLAGESRTKLGAKRNPSRVDERCGERNVREFKTDDRTTSGPFEANFAFKRTSPSFGSFGNLSA
jgi:hypothetical protein